LRGRKSLNKSITQIGQEEKSEPEALEVPLHLRNQSVTNLGIDEDRSVAIPMMADESKDLGKPPLAKFSNHTPKTQKVPSGLENRFRESRNQKFTVR